jgi:hypothetical protein
MVPRNYNWCIRTVLGRGPRLSAQVQIVVTSNGAVCLQRCWHNDVLRVLHGVLTMPPSPCSVEELFGLSWPFRQLTQCRYSTPTVTSGEFRWSCHGPRPLTEFAPTSVHVGFVVNDLTLERVCVRIPRFSPVNVIASWLSTAISCVDVQ